MKNNISKASWWTSIIMRWFVILFLLFDAIIKFIKPEVVINTTINELGYKDHHIIIHGLTGLIPTLLFMISRTRVLGAILLTAHLGGAVASHLRVDNPLFSHTLFPVYTAVLMWGSIWLQEERFKFLFPIAKNQ
ncbi:MAG: DoxX family protein [Sphingobacteriales bacterium]|nr:MAG: DoxX family protein [Sphingobacteriales bacterium]